MHGANSARQLCCGIDIDCRELETKWCNKKFMEHTIDLGISQTALDISKFVVESKALPNRKNVEIYAIWG